MPIRSLGRLGGRRIVGPASVIALGAILLGGCRDSDDGFNPNGLGVDATATGFAATLQAGENQRPSTPDFPPKIEEAARSAEDEIRAGFADRDWIAAVVEVIAEDADMVMIMDTEAAELDDEALLEACTALAGEAFADTGLEPVVIEVRLEDLDGNELRSADGPQCV